MLKGCGTMVRKAEDRELSLLHKKTLMVLVKFLSLLLGRVALVIYKENLGYLEELIFLFSEHSSERAPEYTVLSSDSESD